MVVIVRDIIRETAAKERDTEDVQYIRIKEQKLVKENDAMPEEA